MVKEKKRKQITVDFRHEDEEILREKALKTDHVTKGGKPKIAAYIRTMALTGGWLTKRLDGVDELLPHFYSLRNLYSLYIQNHKELEMTNSQFQELKEKLSLISPDKVINQFSTNLEKVQERNAQIEEKLDLIISQFITLNKNVEKIRER